ncbi:MAG: riboflavin biosynthesis protein RibF, partial [Muribaculaceae bacterium]|nr:riboflavin biosynthesis protein RibF [Muribaculaceae bacterium]
MLHDSENVVALAMGFNNHIGSDRRAAASLAPATSGVEIVPLEELDNRSGVSSSAIRNALIHGKVEEAAALLGRPFEITGTVVHGKQLGRRIGFPTANINLIQPDLIVPADGAYAVDVRLVDGTTHRAMANIGHRPTVDTPDAPLSIEIHIIDFSGNLYGTAINVSFLKRLRPEQRFNSIESLKAQLEIDRQHAILA